MAQRDAQGHFLPGHQIRSPLLFDPPVEEVCTQILETNGNLAAVARFYHTSRNNVANYVARNPAAQQAMVDAHEAKLDMAEASLYRMVLDRNIAAVCFFLKTQGRMRGYIEREQTLNVDVKMENLTIEQLQRLAAGEHPSIVLSVGDQAALTAAAETVDADGFARGGDSGTEAEGAGAAAD